MERKELLQRVQSLVDSTQGVAFIVPEDTGYFSIDDDLVRQVRKLITSTVEVLRDLTDFYDAESTALGEAQEASGDDSDFLKEIGAQISSELAAREVSNLAFVARGQLMEMQETLLGSLEQRNVWAVASHADSGLRHAGKALIAIESAICEYEGFPAPDRRWVDLDDSLETRRLYGQFRRAILRQGDPESRDEVVGRLRNAATRIAILRDLERYPFLRIDDRLTIRRLQKRISAWLAEDGDTEEGKRLWEDLISFARLLIKVNDREELVEHDRQLVTSLHRLLFDPQRPVSQITDGQRKELEQLLGRDDELDQIILEGENLRLDALREAMDKLRDRLQRPFGGMGVPSMLGDV